MSVRQFNYIRHGFSLVLPGTRIRYSVLSSTVSLQHITAVNPVSSWPSNTITTQGQGLYLSRERSGSESALDLGGPGTSACFESRSRRDPTVDAAKVDRSWFRAEGYDPPNRLRNCCSELNIGSMDFGDQRLVHLKRSTSAIGARGSLWSVIFFKKKSYKT